ncbi:hypothetical protein C7Y66_10510 [Chroococcidiopsis sp. CCALA 051]|uniref:hypothetical protein n=1 Tax=Chroococcidiopsis sp. CCALA 051 TaxID=869949 RepID=UPI000D0DF729|nr:hypothetical protein [Chroococcidiopsis sp. CCALA 051]MBE9018900.1 hypothetical protein [Chroococcidiopsidales cyanobacterium LEGE 13417]PSM49153.1 hypothetical protein C7Y66_10510 [Chroococcidiopsis sp. CCALA 051]
MKNCSIRLRGSIAILGVICSSLTIDLPAVAIPQAEQKSVLTSLSHIVTVAPHNSYISQTPEIPQVSPAPVQPPLPEQQQPPNTQVSPTPQVSPSPIQPPLPEQQQPPSTTVLLNQGKVSIKLINQTGAKITYQAIGNTAPRSLPGKSDVTLKNLVTPTTVTFKREDGGLLNATGRSPTPGVLELMLDATTDLGIDKQSLQIQPTGDVFLN